MHVQDILPKSTALPSIKGKFRFGWVTRLSLPLLPTGTITQSDPTCPAPALPTAAFLSEGAIRHLPVARLVPGIGSPQAGMGGPVG